VSANSAETAKLVTYIEENLRASLISGLRFVDTRRNQTRLLSKQNHVVFGRRGAGKTSLVRCIADRGEHIDIYLNLEDYKDITFPNIVIHILIELFGKLLEIVCNEYPWYKFWRLDARSAKKRIRETIKILQSYLREPDLQTQHISTRTGSERGLEASAEVRGVTAGARTGREKVSEIQRDVELNKINYLRIELSSYKKLITQISSLFDNKPVFLVLDDFYFVAKDTQPELIDYFHRLTKGTALFLKLATIKYRSKLYRRRRGEHVGVELGHDVFEIELDYTLDNFAELQSFMREILTNALEQSGAQLDIDDVFAGFGFPQLCLASGGVPRDFLSLFVTLANRTVSTGNPIGKVQVSEAAIDNIASKFASMREDSGNDQTVLEQCLSRIRRYVYSEKRTNAFLIAKPQLETNRLGQQAIRELVDLRLIHLVERNTSKAPSDGRRYEAYIIDLGLYENARPRKFNQVEPGQMDDRSRKDELRASPVFDLEWFEEEPPEHTKERIPPPSRKSEAEGLWTQLSLDLSFE
jgi:hypothetical protein